MPVDKPKAGETQDEYLAYCIPQEIKAGYEKDQAAAICISTYQKDKMSKIKDTTSKVMAKVNYINKFEGINLAGPLVKGPNDPCYEDYVQIGTKDLDGREVPNCVPLSSEADKVQMEKNYNFAEGGAKYPWEDCIDDQTARYGDEETAKRVCGAIKANN